jgi:hypothetical protein
MIKNWYRIFYCLLCATGIILYYSLFVVAPKDAITFPLFMLIAAPIVFFIGTFIYNVLKGFDKSADHWASYIQLLTGFLATLGFAFGAKALFGDDGIAKVLVNDTAANADLIKWYIDVTITMAYVGQLIVFGLMPLIKGINKTLGITGDYVHAIHGKKPEPVIETPAPVVKTRAPRTTAPRAPKPVVAPSATETHALAPTYTAPQPTIQVAVETEPRKPRHNR